VTLEESLLGCLLGTAAGDSIGLPFENLSRASVAKLARLPLEQSLLCGRGLLSDDTEHTVMVGLSLCEAGGDVALFRRRLAARLRWWLLGLPPGIGSATARGILKLWLGFAPAASGVFSAGNGPAMRAAILGVVFAREPELLRDFVQASTRLTHADPKAFEAALAVAVAAACAARLGPVAPSVALQAFAGDYGRITQDAGVMADALRLLVQAVASDQTVADFAEGLGCGRGVSGYALHTVPVALYAWMRHAGDFRQAVTAVVQCGGDTDSTAAVVGALVGAGLGAQAIPASWLEGILEWPRGVAWMRELASVLARAVALRQPLPVTRVSRSAELAWLPWTLLRNLAMLGAVLCVALRRTALVMLRSVTAHG
jgi:ADP-ribosylglycohydrolase